MNFEPSRDFRIKYDGKPKLAQVLTDIKGYEPDSLEGLVAATIDGLAAKHKRRVK